MVQVVNDRATGNRLAFLGPAAAGNVAGTTTVS